MAGGHTKQSDEMKRAIEQVMPCALELVHVFNAARNTGPDARRRNVPADKRPQIHG